MPDFKYCIKCGTPFISDHPRKVFCTAQCATKAANIRYRNRGKQNICERDKVLQQVKPEYIEPKPAEPGKESFTDILSFLDEASKKEK